MIYLLEDDESIRDNILDVLSKSRLPAVSYNHPNEFWNAIKTIIPELILLDSSISGEDSQDMIKKLRENDETRDLPVLLMTTQDQDEEAYSSVAYCIAKPFSNEELLSRILTIVTPNDTDDNDYICGELYINTSKRQVQANGNNVTLTLKEYELLLLLVKNCGRVLARSEMLSEIWGYSFDGESRTVDVHIRTLRAKLDNCGKYIDTVRGIGYRFNVKKNKK